jgi:ABC-2 type transport system ATP-binding protein
MTTTTTTRPAPRISGLRKSFGEMVVLDGIDVEIAEGRYSRGSAPTAPEKTTTVHILATLLSTDEGEVEVAGFDPRRRMVRRHRHSRLRVGARPLRPRLGASPAR